MGKTSKEGARAIGGLLVAEQGRWTYVCSVVIFAVDVMFFGNINIEKREEAGGGTKKNWTGPWALKFFWVLVCCVVGGVWWTLS